MLWIEQGWEGGVEVIWDYLVGLIVFLMILFQESGVIDLFRFCFGFRFLDYIGKSQCVQLVFNLIFWDYAKENEVVKVQFMVIEE